MGSAACCRRKFKGSSWPRPGSPWGHSKQTLAGRAISLKVSFLAPLRTHTGRQERTVAPTLDNSKTSSGKLSFVSINLVRLQESA